MAKTSTSWAKGQSGNPAGRPKSAFHSILKDMMKDIAFNPYHGREATRARELIMQNLITVAATGNFECPTGGTRQVSDKVWLSATRLLIKLLGDVDDDNPPLPTRTEPDPFIEKTRASEPHKTAHVSRLSPTYIEPDPSTDADLPVLPDLSHLTPLPALAGEGVGGWGDLPVLPDLSARDDLPSPRKDGYVRRRGAGAGGGVYTPSTTTLNLPVSPDLSPDSYFPSPVLPDLSASGDLPSPRKDVYVRRRTGVPRKCEAFVGWCGAGVGGGV